MQNIMNPALAEIKTGRKYSHWIWYIFPQIKGLGFSRTAVYYGIEGSQEARDYISNDVLRLHLIEISEALLVLKSDNIREIMGYPDDLKLKSCMTLFRNIAPEIEISQKILDRFFGGEHDMLTEVILEKEAK